MLLTYAVNRVILQNINGICHKRAERGEYDAKAQKVPKGVPDAADKEFHPLGRACGDPAVILTVDEYEAIRLIDRQGFSQEECSAYVQVPETRSFCIIPPGKRMSRGTGRGTGSAH